MESLPKIIGLTGRAYAGKTTVAEHLVKTHGYTQLAFGDALKTMLITAGMCTHGECYTQKTEQSRWLLQKIGTEIFRKQVHPDFWAQQTAKRVHELLAHDKRVIIDDIRFENEARIVRAYMGEGLLVKLVRLHDDGTPYRGAHGSANEHESETSVDGIDCAYTISAESGHTDFLINEIDAILTGRKVTYGDS